MDIFIYFMLGAAGGALLMALVLLCAVIWDALKEL